ncbi:uncharacterized protein LOC129569479 [Sitodiplosis mosellana]|uniref:uncharacterized protein LOC129569479 n=1 Tax=Sitodiplosis mosellana TaxID=263140 RepID=UPI002443808A|nr:uncharacterized protein LOC129569479 [Sitodiplosis mosellana]
MARRLVSVKRGINGGATQSGCPRVAKREVTYEFMTGFNYNSNLLYVKEEQQFYRRNGVAKGTICLYYTCYVRGCHCKMHIRDGKCFVAGSRLHNHPNQAEMYVNLCALNEMKRIMRSVNNHLMPKQVFDSVMKRHPKSTYVYSKIFGQSLCHSRYYALRKIPQNLPEETTPDSAADTAEVTLVSNAADCIIIDDSQYQSCLEDVTKGTLDVDCIEPIEPTPSDKSIEFHATNRVDLDKTTVSTRAKPKETSTPCVDLTSDVFNEAVQPLAESKNIAFNSTQASTTCAPIVEAANVLRDMKNSKDPNKPSSQSDINADSTLVPSHLQLTVGNNGNNWTLRSPPQRANKENVRVDSATSNDRSERLTTFDAFAQSTENKVNSTQERIAQAAIELRNMHISKKPNKRSTRVVVDADSTLVPSYVPCMAEKNKNNWTLHSSPQRANKKNGREIASTSQNEFHVVYIREADVNRLVRSGHIRFVQGKLQYDEPILC